jgi:hypothetical protein
LKVLTIIVIWFLPVIYGSVLILCGNKKCKSKREKREMKKLIIAALCLSLCGLSTGAEHSKSKEDGSGTKEIKLFNGKNFKGWELYLPETDGKVIDPKTVWSVKDGVVRCEGKPNGYMRTKKKYADFKLELEWSWPENPTNSGVLLRIEGEDATWPKCLEAQLMHENAGDFWAMKGCEFNEISKRYPEWNGATKPKEEDNSEKAPGQWNKYEITCVGDTVELVVNGVKQNKATGVNVLEGYIGLQSEGSPIMFRNINLTRIK